jgi:hypothetical protein
MLDCCKQTSVWAGPLSLSNRKSDYQTPTSLRRWVAGLVFMRSITGPLFRYDPRISTIFTLDFPDAKNPENTRRARLDRQNRTLRCVKRDLFLDYALADVTTRHYKNCSKYVKSLLLLRPSFTKFPEAEMDIYLFFLLHYPKKLRDGLNTKTLFARDVSFFIKITKIAPVTFLMTILKYTFNFT